MSTEVVSIRRASPEELARLHLEIEQATVPFDVDHWRRQSQVAGSFTYVMALDHIVGFVSAGSAELPDESIGEIFALWLAPEIRRQGWGRKLLVRGISVLKRRDFSRGLCFLSEEPNAIKLIEGLGFEVSKYERVSHKNSPIARQVGYLLDLTDYF